MQCDDSQGTNTRSTMPEGKHDIPRNKEYTILIVPSDTYITQAVQANKAPQFSLNNLVHSLVLGLHEVVTFK